MSQVASPPPPPTFEWKRWPETETFVDDLIAKAVAGNTFAATLAERMRAETSTRFKDWVDHLVVSGQEGLGPRLRELGFKRQATDYGVGVPVFAHEGGIFPRLAIAPGSGLEVSSLAIKVESIADFSRAFDLGLDVRGYVLGPYRVGRVPGERTDLEVVERRALHGFDPFPGDLAREGRMRPHAARDALAARELWKGRKTPVRRRRQGLRRDRADLGTGHRTGRFGRPGLPPRLRGRA